MVSDKFILIQFVNFYGWFLNGRVKSEHRTADCAKSSIAKLISLPYGKILAKYRCIRTLFFRSFRLVIVKFNLNYSHFVCFCKHFELVFFFLR